LRRVLWYYHLIHPSYRAQEYLSGSVEFDQFGFLRCSGGEGEGLSHIITAGQHCVDPQRHSCPFHLSSLSINITLITLTLRLYRADYYSSKNDVDKVQSKSWNTTSLCDCTRNYSDLFISVCTVAFASIPCYPLSTDDLSGSKV